MSSLVVLPHQGRRMDLPLRVLRSRRMSRLHLVLRKDLLSMQSRKLSKNRMRIQIRKRRLTVLRGYLLLDWRKVMSHYWSRTPTPKL
jgi:hypothetical protein